MEVAQGRRSGSGKLPPPSAAPLRGYPTDSSGSGYHHSAAPGRGRKRLPFRRTGVLVGLAKTVASEQEDLGVLHQPVGNGSGNRCVVENVSPVRERCVGRDHRRFLLAVSGGDHLIKKIGGLLIEGQVTKLVTDQK